MTTFNLSGCITVSVYTEVEAETLEEAIEIAMTRDVVAYHWGDKTQALEYWVNDEYDGEVQNITKD